jgi:hypothetical protein
VTPLQLPKDEMSIAKESLIALGLIGLTALALAMLFRQRNASALLSGRFLVSLALFSIVLAMMAIDDIRSSVHRQRVLVGFRGCGLLLTAILLGGGVVSDVGRKMRSRRQP